MQFLCSLYILTIKTNFDIVCKIYIILCVYIAGMLTQFSQFGLKYNETFSLQIAFSASKVLKINFYVHVYMFGLP